MTSILADLAIQKPEIEEEKIWTKILQEVSSESNKISQGSAIVLGDPHCGKTSLITRIVNVDRPHHPSVFEYNFLTVNANEDNRQAYQITSSANLFGTQDHMNLPFYICDGSDDRWRRLYEFAFPKQLSKCVVVLCASFADPEKILESLQKWYKVIEESVRKYYSEDEINEAKQTQMKFWQEYVEPAENTYVESSEFKSNLLEPEQDVLTESCGISVMVVLTKTDDKAYLVDNELLRLQWKLRQFCLRHGASLFYTSAKNDINTELLRKYIAHRVYGAPFTKTAHIVDQASIFIPSGWDSQKKLEAEKEMFDTHSSKEEEKKKLTDTIDSAREKVQCEDEQTFLQALSNALTQEPSATKQREANPNSPANPPATNASPLANFFGGLMKGGTTNGAAAPPSQPKTDPAQLFQNMAAGR